jgi:hypothetical protein
LQTCQQNGQRADAEADSEHRPGRPRAARPLERRSGACAWSREAAEARQPMTLNSSRHQQRQGQDKERGRRGQKPRSARPTPSEFSAPAPAAWPKAPQARLQATYSRTRGQGVLMNGHGAMRPTRGAVGP